MRCIGEILMEKSYCPAFGELPYVMKKHWATRYHDDLRLAWLGVSLSWALPEGAPHRAGETRAAIEMEDHNRANLLFEGVHETGTIMVWDRGTWEPLIKPEHMLTSLERGFLRFALRGERLQGIFTLTRTDVAGSARRAAWILRKESDLFGEASIHSDGPVGPPKSICTGRTKEDIDRDWKKAKKKGPQLFN